MAVRARNRRNSRAQSSLLPFQHLQPIVAIRKLSVSTVFHCEVGSEVNWFCRQALMMEDCLNPAVPVQLQCELLRYFHMVMKFVSTNKMKDKIIHKCHMATFCLMNAGLHCNEKYFKSKQECCFCKHRCLNINQSCAPILLKYLTIYWLSLTVIVMVVMKGWCQVCLSVPCETAAGVIAVLKSTNLFPSLWPVLCKCKEQRARVSHPLQARCVTCSLPLLKVSFTNSAVWSKAAFQAHSSLRIFNT